MLITAVYGVHLFLAAHLVNAHYTTLQHLLVKVSARSQVTTVQVVHVEFAVHVWAFKALNQLAVNFLLNALGPGGNCVACKLQILLLNIVECCLTRQLYKRSGTL